MVAEPAVLLTLPVLPPAWSPMAAARVAGAGARLAVRQAGVMIRGRGGFQRPSPLTVKAA